MVLIFSEKSDSSKMIAKIEVLFCLFNGSQKRMEFETYQMEAPIKSRIPFKTYCTS